MNETVLVSRVRKGARICGKFLNPGIAQKGERNLKGVEPSEIGNGGDGSIHVGVILLYYLKTLLHDILRGNNYSKPE
jgi:hypothetical protein